MQTERFKDKFKNAFSKPTIDNVTKMYIFNFAQTKNSVLFWFFWSLFLISQPILSITFYMVKRNTMLDYSLLMILIPLILGFVFSTVVIYLLFQDNKTNSIEMKLICSKFSRKQVLVSRLCYILTAIFVNIVAQDLFLVMFPIVDMTKFGVALFIANTFITPFILMLYVFCLVMLTYKFGKITFLLLSIAICILTLGLSLITRPFINRENYMQYNTNKPVFYTKLTDKENDIVIASSNDHGIENGNNISRGEKIIDTIKWSNWPNNLILSEWTLSFYQSLFANMNFGVNITNAPYNLVKVNVTDDTGIDKIDMNTVYSLRANDFDFTKVNNSNYKLILLDDITKIIEKYGLDKNPSKAISFLDQFDKYFKWSDETMNPEFKSFLADGTGVNTKYNQLFYFIKYNEQLSKKIPNLFTTIGSKYGNDVSELFKKLLTSASTNYNLFKVNDVLGTGRNIDTLYPMMSSRNLDRPIINADKLFLKDELIKYLETQDIEGKTKWIFMYRDSSGVYRSSATVNGQEEDFSKILEQIDKSIVDYQSWCRYVDQISVTWNTTQDFLNKLQQKVTTIFPYELSNNSVDTSDAILFLKPYYSSQIQAAPLFISIYILLLFTMAWLSFNKYKKAKII